MTYRLIGCTLGTVSQWSPLHLWNKEGSRVKVVSVRSEGKNFVRLQYDDGVSIVADLAPYLRGPVFDAIRSDEDRFSEVRVDPLFGSIFWPNGADIAPECFSASERTTEPVGAPSIRTPRGGWNTGLPSGPRPLMGGVDRLLEQRGLLRGRIHLEGCRPVIVMDSGPP